MTLTRLLWTAALGQRGNGFGVGPRHQLLEGALRQGLDVHDCDPVEPGQIPGRLNAGHYRELYTPASRERVATVFADTIEAFGYEF